MKIIDTTKLYLYIKYLSMIVKKVNGELLKRNNFNYKPKIILYLKILSNEYFELKIFYI